METLALSFTSGWASGLNAYLVVLVLGITDKVHDFADVPDVLARWDVLGIAAFMFSIEFVADKVPWVDSTWDAVSTVVRPVIGAILGVLLAGDATSLEQAVSGTVGGGTALLSHLAKASTRLAINTSPEPVTNIGASFAENFAVLGLVALAIQHPEVAAVIAAVLLIAGLALAWFLSRLVRKGWRRFAERRDRRRVPGDTPSGAAGPDRRP